MLYKSDNAIDSFNAEQFELYLISDHRYELILIKSKDVVDMN
jgi:hypothetical protein